MAPIANWDDVRRKLDLLRERDNALTGFGAPTHKYVTRPVVESELEALEHDLGARLPDDFRAFLLEVGYGAGPYYGVYGAPQVLDEVRDGLDIWMEDSETLSRAWLDHAKANGEWPRLTIPSWVEWMTLGWSDYVITRGGWPTPDRPFPFTRAQAETIPQGQAWQAVLEAPYPAPGCILIGHQGCSYYTVIVTAGALTGSVWELWHEPCGHGTWLPARCTSANIYREPPRLRQVPIFREWYTGWLDASLADLPYVKQDTADARAKREARL